MKKVFFTLIPIVIIVMGCAGGAKTAGSGGLTLDQAIKESAIEIDQKVASGTKIALLNFTSSAEGFSSYVLDELTANLVGTGKLTVVDRKEMDLIRSESNFQLSGEVSDDSIQAIGQKLGAQSIVSGSLQDIGGSYRIVIRVLNVESAAVVVQYRNDIANDSRVQALLAGGRSGGTATAGGTGGGGQTAQAATSARATAPQNGTYAFWPRPQATRAGTPVKAYLDQVVVRGGYIIFYLYGQPSGKSGDPEGDNWWYLTGDHVILQDLDNPRFSWEGLDRGHLEPNGKTLTFQGVTGKRFSLTNTRDKVPVVFEEIDLNKAEYQP